MSAKHTQWPWKFSHSIPEDGFECFWIESDDEFRNVIADVRGPQNEECTANARLIAAAPDLLDALTEIVAAADGDVWKQLDATFAAARAAIAKATGEQ